MHQTCIEVQLPSCLTASRDERKSNETLSLLFFQRKAKTSPANQMSLSDAYVIINSAPSPALRIVFFPFHIYNNYDDFISSPSS